MLSDPERRRLYDAFGHDGLRTGGWSPRSAGAGGFEDIFEAFFGRGDPLFGELFGFGRAGPAAGGDIGADVEISLAEVVTGATRERELRGGDDLRPLPRQRRRARDADPGLRRLRRLGPGSPRHPDGARPARPRRRLPRLRRRRADRRAAVRAVLGEGPRRRDPDLGRRRPGRDRVGPANPDHAAPATPARPVGDRATSTSASRSPTTSAFAARAPTSSASPTCSRPPRCWAAG